MEVERLAENLTGESKAYGYTLTIWGGGSLTIAQYQTPNALQIFLYVGGALAAFAALAVIAFDELFEDTGAGADQKLVIASMVHVLATVGNLALTYVLIIAMKSAGFPAAAVFAVVGFEGTFTYNAMLLLEDRLAEVVTWLGRRAKPTPQ